MTDVMDTLFLEQTHTQQQNLTTLQKFEHMYVMIQFTTAMMATTVGTLLVIGITFMFVLLKKGQEEAKPVNPARQKNITIEKGII